MLTQNKISKHPFSNECSFVYSENFGLRMIGFANKID